MKTDLNQLKTQNNKKPTKTVNWLEKAAYLKQRKST